MEKNVVKLNGKAVCEDFLEGFEAENACTEDISTCWKAAPYFKWWMLELQSECFIDRVQIIFGHEGEYYHYHVEISTDRINWQFIEEKADNRLSTAEGDTVVVNSEARFIKITISYCSKGSMVTLQNVAAFGYVTGKKEEQTDITRYRVKAVNATKIVNFDSKKTETDHGWYDDVISCEKAGGYICFEQVNFEKDKYDQIRFCLGLPEKDKSFYVNIEFRLDAVDGEKVGNIHLCRQYTYYTELAAELLKPNGEKISGKHDLYFVVTQVDEPQSVLIYWLKLTKHTELSAVVTDYHEKLIEDEKDYSIFFGDMHCHTGLTDGYGTAEHAYEYARNVAHMDFLGITEHSNCLDEMFDCDKSFKWRDLKKASEKATEDGKFVGLYGSETTWYNQFGHMNIYCADFYINSYEFKFDDAKTYYSRLKEFPGLISQWNHPWSCGKRHLDYFEPYDEELDKITYTIELNNIELIKDDVLKYYVIALDKGWHLSPVGNQDNHKEDWGTQNGIRTGIIARRLTAADIFDAMKNRRTYFTGVPGFRVMYYMNGAIQGSEIEDSDDFEMEVEASCDDECRIVSIEIYGEQGHIVDTIEVDGSWISVTHTVKKKQRYYFLKLIREDMQIAVTAPIWIKNK